VQSLYFTDSKSNILGDNSIYIEFISEYICFSFHETIHRDSSSSESEIFSDDRFFRYFYLSSCDIHISGCAILEFDASTCCSDIARYRTIDTNISSGDHEIVLDISFDFYTSTSNYRIISNASIYHQLSSGEDKVSLCISCDIHLPSSSIQIIGCILFDT